MYNKSLDKKEYINLKLNNYDYVIAKLSNSSIDSFVLYKPHNQDWMPLNSISKSNVIGQGLLLCVKDKGRFFTEKQFYRKFAKYFLQ